MLSIKFDNRHIILKIFGIKLTLKQMSNLFLINKFARHKVKNNAILIIEMNICHNETIPGYCKYLKNLGYNVEILVNRFSETDFLNIDNIKVWKFSFMDMLTLFSTVDFTKYERIIFNSKIIYTITEENLFEICNNIPFGQKENLYVQHHLERIDDDSAKQIVLANPSKLDNLEKFIVNPHYFVENTQHNKNNKTIFATIGEISLKRKNFPLLIDAIEKLLEQNINNFQVVVIGFTNSVKIPEKVSPYIKILGRLTFAQMYEELKKVDFILPLLDKSIEEHKRYIKNGTSGTFQLAYGFIKPCIIQKCFADKYELNDMNSFIYEENEEFCQSLAKAIKMTNKEYQNMYKHLEDTSLRIQKQSEINLGNMLKSSTNEYDLVSLGENCLVRRYLSRMGLKRTKQQGELSCPFDLAVTPIKSLIQILNNNFADYFKNLEYSEQYSAWVNKKYHILYNHDIDCTKYDKNKLIKRFKLRIMNFRQIIETSPYIYFICKADNSTKRIKSLLKILKKLRKGLPFKLIILNFSNNDSEYISKDLSIYSLTNPFKNNDAWWKEIESKDSINFQSKIQKVIAKEIEKHFEIKTYSKHDVG